MTVDLIITRHAPLISYFIEIGLATSETPVVPHVDSMDQVQGLHVVGVLPYHIAAAAKLVTIVPLALTHEDRETLKGADIPLERLRQIAGAPETYKLEKLG